MRYLCLVYFEAKDLQALSPSEGVVLTRDSLAYDQELDRAGRLVLAHALQPVSTATTVRVRDGRMSTTDGPFAETKEILGGFILVEAEDLDQAIHIAAGIPLAKLGSIEVRPIMDL